jgi:hypothetical protein
MVVPVWYHIVDAHGVAGTGAKRRTSRCREGARSGANSVPEHPDASVGYSARLPQHFV